MKSLLLWVQLGLVVAIAGHLGLQHFGDRLEDFWVGAGIHGLATLCYVYLSCKLVCGAWRPSFVWALCLVLLTRLLVLPLVPALSDDVFRYLHEGHLVLERHNPYLLAPIDTPEHLRLATHDQINHPDVPAAYPPMVQLCLAMGYLVNPSAMGMKIVFGALDVLSFLVLWVWLPKVGVSARRSLIYGLCPLVILQFTGEGHSDSLMVFLLLLTLWAATVQRRLLSACLLALAAASKVLPVVLLPFVARRRPAAWVLFGGVLGVMYAPVMLDALMRDRSVFDVFEGVRVYADLWRHNDSLFAGAREVSVWGLRAMDLNMSVDRAARALVALLGVGFMILAWRRHWPLKKVAAGALMFFVACSPTMHPWYLAMLVPLLCVYPSVWMLAFTGTIYVAHSTPGREHVDVAVKVLEYTPFYLGLLLQLRVRANAGGVPQASPRDAGQAGD